MNTLDITKLFDATPLGRKTHILYEANAKEHITSDDVFLEGELNGLRKDPNRVGPMFQELIRMGEGGADAPAGQEVADQRAVRAEEAEEDRCDRLPGDREYGGDAKEFSHKLTTRPKWRQLELFTDSED